MHSCRHCPESFARACNLGQHIRQYPSGSCVAVFGARPAAAASGAAVRPDEAADCEQHDPLAAGLDPADVDAGGEESSAARTESPAFNSTHALLHLFATLNNGGGLAKEDQQAVLDFIHHQNLDISSLPKEAAEFRDIRDRLLEQQRDGWQECEIDLSGVWPSNATFRYRDGVAWLTELWERPDLAGHLVYWAAEEFKAGKRILSEPRNADVWLAAQQQLRESWRLAEGDEEHCVALLQVYSDKTNCNKTTTAYPIKAALLNIERTFKIKHIGILGFIPTLPPAAGMSEDHKRAARRVLLATCLGVALQSLARASHVGLYLVGPDGSSKLVHPRLGCYTADNPEQHQVLGLFCTCSCSMPCARCTAPGDKLGQVNLQFELRSAASQAQIRARIAAAATKGEAAAIASAYSTHPEAPGLLGFAAQHLTACDPHQVVPWDHLHNWDLGIVKYLVDGVKAYVLDHAAAACSRQIRDLDRFLCEMPRAEGLTLPSHRKYFEEPANLQGKEHRAVLQVFPHLVHGLGYDELTAVVGEVCQLSMMMYTRRRPDHFTEKDLEAIDKQITKVDQLMRASFPGMNFDTIKYHSLSHFTEDVRRYGHPEHINSDVFEFDHIWIKIMYRGTSKKRARDQFIAEVVRQRRLLNMLDGLPGTVTGVLEERHYATALMQAADSSEHTLSTSYDTVSLDAVAGVVQAAALQHAAMARASEELRARHPTAARLQHRLREYVLDQAVTRREYNRTNLPALGFDRVRIHSHAVLAADCPWEPEGLLLQTIRANPSFHGKPFFSDVAVRVAQGSRATVGYAQVLVLLSAQLGPTPEWQPLAMVQWYKRVQAADALTRLGAIALQHEMVHDPAAGGTVPRTCIIPLSSIIRNEYIVPDFSKQGRFHVSPFKH